MNESDSSELSKHNLDRLAIISLSAATLDQPGLDACLTADGACMAKSQDRSQTRKLAPGPSTTKVDNEVADIQPQPSSPMKAIPVEVFEAVVSEVVKDFLSLSIPDYYNTVTQMRLVCRRWTAILEGMPEVWANLSMSMEERLIDLALSRSMHSPLRITGYLYSSLVLDKLFQHIDRWKYLNVFLESNHIMDRLSVHSAPLLEELSFEPSSSSPPTILFNDSAPMLRAVEIRSCGVEWSTSVLSSLHELVLFDLQEGVPDVAALLTILSNSPKLNRLSVRYTRLRPSPSHRTLISLSCLRSLELVYVGEIPLKQLVESIEIPRSTTCRFAINWDNDDIVSLVEHLEPIHRRHSTLAKVSRGSRSILTLGSGLGDPSIRTTYEGEAHQLGTLTVEVEAFPRCKIDVLEYFARQLGQGEPDPVPPVLHIIDATDRAAVDYDMELLQKLRVRLPNTDEILIEDLSPEFMQDVFDTLFPPKHSSQPFPRFSTLTIRSETHDEWAYRLQRRQKRGFLGGGVNPLPSNTLRIEGGVISAEKVRRLKELVLNLVLDRVEVNQTAGEGSSP